MNRRQLIWLGLPLAIPVGARGNAPQNINQSINTVYLPGEVYNSIFLPSLGATRISALVSSEVQGSAFLDVSNSNLDSLTERDIVYGVAEKTLSPRRAILMAIPAEFLVFEQVRLRLVNEDKTFGRVRATLSVWRD
jgi:hypothetical protein